MSKREKPVFARVADAEPQLEAADAGVTTAVRPGTPATPLTMVPTMPPTTAPATAPAIAPAAVQDMRAVRVANARVSLRAIRSDKKKVKGRQEQRITIPLALDLYDMIDEVSHQDKTFMCDDIETILRRFYFPDEFTTKE